MGGLADQTWPFGRPGLLLVLIAMVCAIGKADPSWIQEVPDGLELQADEHCFVIAGEWMVLVSIDEPRPPPELISTINDLQ